MKSRTLVVCLLAIVTHVRCHSIVFNTTECLNAHNQLRQLHVNTNNLEYSYELERDAGLAVRAYHSRDDTKDVRPTRILPKRRRRRHEDVENRHLEEWDGDIYYPKRTSDLNSGRIVRIGESIHKFCCTSFPHCPAQFFHNLHFPPSAAGVVKDWYNEEVGGYNFQTGEKKSQFSQIDEFASIVWQNTTKLGCAQSSLSNAGCIYTVVIYSVEGAVGTPEDFRRNIGSFKSETEESKEKLIITVFLVVFFIVLIVGAIVLCYCCRQNIQDKLVEIRIKTDTMKAEQELETDSTSFWWLRFLRTQKKRRRTTTVSRPKRVSLLERPTIEVVPNSAPLRTMRPSQRVRGDSNAASYARYHGISKKPEIITIQDNYGYDSGRPSKPLPYRQALTNDDAVRNKAMRAPSLSGKAPPPEPPSEKPIYGNIDPIPLVAVKNKPLLPTPPVLPTSKPLKPVTKVPSLPLTANKTQLSSKPSTPDQTRLPLLPGARNSPQTQPRPFSSPVNQTNKPIPVPRKNTAPIEEAAGRHSPTVKPKPLLPPTSKLKSTK